MEIREEFEERGRVLEAEIRFNTERYLCFCVAIDVDVEYDLSINDWQRLGYSNRFVFESVAIDVDVDYDLSINDRQRLGLILR